jgi:capsid protein
MQPTANLLDRVITATFPEWGARRMLARGFMNSLKSGLSTRLSEGFSTADGFRFGTSSERMENLTTRNRAYQAYDNNPVARTLVQTETDNVIGDGLNYQPSSSSEEWNREAKDRYYAWLEECSVRGPDVETGCEIQRSAWAYSRVAGDLGWVLASFGPESRVQLVRAENISTPDGKYSDKTIYDGIKFNELGQPVTFYVLSHDEYGKRDWKPIPARDFVWLPHMTKPGQARPPSCYSTIFDLLSHLDRYIDGVSLAAWMATVMGIVFKQNNPGRALSQLGTATNSQGNLQKAMTFENGMVKYIGTDEEVAQVQATQPMQQTPEFIRTMMRQIGNPFDMPLEVFAKDMSNCNFASARIGLLPYYRSCRIKAGRFASRWSRTIRWWLSRERLRAQDDPRKWVTAFPPDYWSHDLMPNEWDYTDPVSEVQSDMLQCDAGFKSPPMVMTERGRDAQLITQQRRDWLTMTKGLPQTYSTMSRDPAPEPQATQDKPAPAGEGDAGDQE